MSSAQADGIPCFALSDLGGSQLTRLRGFEGYVNRNSFEINPSA